MTRGKMNQQRYLHRKLCCHKFFELKNICEVSQFTNWPTFELLKEKTSKGNIKDKLLEAVSFLMTNNKIIQFYNVSGSKLAVFDDFHSHIYLYIIS